jgi:hypothetical protein
MPALRRPTWTEAVLLALLGAVLGALAVTGVGPGGGEALAGAVGAAPAGRVLAVAGNGDRSDFFYLVDTARQVVCVYRWSNPGLRLVSARSYDYDLELLDTAEDKIIESRGATRGYVKAQVELQRRARLPKPLER